jgi:hypothetical protein
MREKRKLYKILVRRLEGKRPLGKPRRRYKDNIKMKLKEMYWEGVEWTYVAHDEDR